MQELALHGGRLIGGALPKEKGNWSRSRRQNSAQHHLLSRQSLSWHGRFCLNKAASKKHAMEEPWMAARAARGLAGSRSPAGRACCTLYEADQGRQQVMPDPIHCHAGAAQLPCSIPPSLAG